MKGCSENTSDISFTYSAFSTTSGHQSVCRAGTRTFRHTGSDESHSFTPWGWSCWHSAADRFVSTQITPHHIHSHHGWVPSSHILAGVFILRFMHLAFVEYLPSARRFEFHAWSRPLARYRILWWAHFSPGIFLRRAQQLGTAEKAGGQKHLSCVQHGV